MSDVGDLLELLHGAADRWTTVRATVRVWRDVAAGEHATQRWLRGANGGASVLTSFVAGGDEGRPETDESTQQIWVAKPDRWREERDGHVTAGCGGLWWSQSPYYGFLSNEDDLDSSHSGPLEQYAAHLDPAHVLPLLHFAAIVREDGLLVVRAQERPGRGFAGGIALGADEHVLTVDGARGIVLRIDSSLDGRRFNTSELVDPVWDGELDDDLFLLQPPPGEQARSPGAIHQLLTVDEAAARASFPVFAIDELPGGQWRVDAHYHAAVREQAEMLHLMYHRGDARGQITVVEHPVRPKTWATAGGTAHVVLDRDGTFITISSHNYDEDVLRGLADGLVRV